MSDAVYPVLPGATPEVTRTPIWNTTTKTSTSGREFRSANWSAPIYAYKLGYEVLRQNFGLTEMATLAGFFNARKGSFETFLFTDPGDNSVTGQLVGIGTGSEVEFQLARAFGGYVEPVLDLNGSPSIYVDGVLKTLSTDYSISATGLVTFVVAPAIGLPVTWTGSYYRRVRFAQDSAEFQKFLHQLWSLKTVELRGVKA